MRIVLAIDGSPSADQAAHLIASLPWPSGTSIALLTVYEIPTAWLTEAVITTDDWLSGAERALRREADARLSTIAEAFEGGDVAIECHVVRDRAATAILATTAELAADVVVVGSRGHGPITSMLLGSVSAEVAAQAPCSVLVVRSDHVGRLLVGADGSDCAAIIPDVLADWATFTGLPATAVSVTPVDSPGFELLMGLYTLGSESMASQREDLQQRHRHHAEAMAERLSAIGIPARPEVRNGDPAHEIVAAATDSRADLVVTGSRCLHGVDRWLLGSVARDVLLHTAASVLIIRQKGVPTAR